MRLRLGLFVVLGAIFCGCATKQCPTVKIETEKPVKNVKSASDVQRRKFTDKQIDVLRSFALTESPVLWQTVQTLKAEKATRKAGLDKLCKEMREFGRNPELDPDVAALKSAYEGLDGSLAVIYGKIEDAYIAYKKMQATPGRKEYADLMKTALEDGIQEADSAVARYRSMSRNK